MEELTIEKLLKIKKTLDEIEKNRPKYYDENGKEYILINLRKEPR